MVNHIERRKTSRQGSTADDDRVDIGILLALAFGAFSTELRGAVSKKGHDGLHRSFGYVARNLAAAESLTLTDLAARLGITTPGALKIVQAIEDSGHLERVPDPNDARAKRLRLTKSGKVALEAARDFHQSFEAKLIAIHGEKKVAIFRSILSAIVADYEEEAETTIFLRPM